MSILQVSRIQVRRGKKNAGTGLPQLASGEFGWAVDTQELFIGNGSVAEGAPFVGNTKIITANDNIIDFAIGNYEYKHSDPSFETNNTQRPLQDRLDEHVSVKAFGAKGDGITDDTSAIQLAINQLYLEHRQEKYRVTLEFPAGIYIISEPIRIPSYTSLKGVGKDKTIIKQIKLNHVFETIIDGSASGSYLTILDGHVPSTCTKNVSIADITFKNDTARSIALCYAIEDCYLKNVKFQGSWESPENTIFSAGIASGIMTVVSVTSGPIVIGQQIISADLVTIKESDNVFITGKHPDSIQYPNVYYVNSNVVGNLDLIASFSNLDNGIELVSLNSDTITCTNNTIDNCEFINLSQGIVSKYDIKNNVLLNCKFENLLNGIIFGYNSNGSEGQAKGPQYTKISNSLFKDIYRKGVWVEKGTYNISSHNSFIKVGNNGGSSLTTTYPIIEFTEIGNISDNDYFERSVDLSTDQQYITSVPYISEYAGHVKGNHKFNNPCSIITATQPSTLFRLGAFNNAQYKVHYTYQGTTVVRSGVLVISLNKTSNIVQLTDDYTATGTNIENLSFTAQLSDMNSNLDFETIVINYTNLTQNDTGVFNFWYEVIS